MQRPVIWCACAPFGCPRRTPRDLGACKYGNGTPHFIFFVQEKRHAMCATCLFGSSGEDAELVAHGHRTAPQQRARRFCFFEQCTLIFVEPNRPVRVQTCAARHRHPSEFASYLRQEETAQGGKSCQSHGSRTRNHNRSSHIAAAFPVRYMAACVSGRRWS